MTKPAPAWRIERAQPFPGTMSFIPSEYGAVGRAGVLAIWNGRELTYASMADAKAVAEFLYRDGCTLELRVTDGEESHPVRPPSVLDEAVAAVEVVGMA